MLTLPQLQRFAHESGIRNLQVVEKEILLTYLLQLLAEKGFLKEVAFKGGTCIRKTWFGARGRFSTDLDFTCVTAGKRADDFVMQLAECMSEPFHDIQFDLGLGDDGWYETGDGVSWGCEPHYKHSRGEGTIKLQASNREVATLMTDDRAQLEVSYFKLLPFKPSAIPCLRIERNSCRENSRRLSARQTARHLGSRSIRRSAHARSPDQKTRRDQALAGKRCFCAR